MKSSAEKVTELKHAKALEWFLKSVFDRECEEKCQQHIVFSFYSCLYAYLMLSSPFRGFRAVDGEAPEMLTQQTPVSPPHPPLREGGENMFERF